MTASDDGGANLPSRARAWFDRLSRVKKALATSAALVVTVGGVASATTAVLDLGQRLGGGPEVESVSSVETAVPEKTRVREGVRVTEVIPDSPAARAGLEVGDVVTDINGESIEDVDEFEAALERARPGDTALISLVRDSRRESVPVKLEPVEGTDLTLGTRVTDIKPDEVVFVYVEESGPGLPDPETTTAPGQETTGGEPTAEPPDSSPAADQYAPQ